MIGLLVKTTVLLALAWLAVRLLPRASAAMRHRLLLATFGALAALPVAIALLAPQDVRLPAWPWHVTRAIAPGVRLLQVEAAPSSQERLSGAGSLRASQRGGWPSFASVAMALWALGTALSVSQVAVGVYATRRLRREVVPWPEAQAIADAISAGSFSPGGSPTRRALVGRADSLDGPVTFGLWPAVVALPASARRWNEDSLRRALIHELAHLHRRDWLAQLAARMVCAGYWFHPLGWSALRRLRFEAECACDAVVAIREDGTAYAEQLLQLAHAMTARPRTATVGMVTSSDLAARVRALLERPRVPAPDRAWSRRLVFVAAAVVVAGIAPLRSAGDSDGDPRTWPRFDRISIAVADGSRPTPDPGARFSTEQGGMCEAGRWISGDATCIRASGVTLRELIAFGFAPSALIPPVPAILGGPAWIDTTRFDIVAMTPRTIGGPVMAQPAQALMIRALLADHFGLALHHESRRSPIYDLTRTGETTGPRLRPPDPACAAALANTRPDAFFPPAHPLKRCIGVSGRGFVRATIAMPQLAAIVGNRLNRVVRDATGLRGFYDVDLEWGPPGVVPVAARRPGPELLTLPERPIFTALRDQLGLTLVDATGPVDVIVVDRASEPRRTGR